MGTLAEFFPKIISALTFADHLKVKLKNFNISTSNFFNSTIFSRSQTRANRCTGKFSDIIFLKIWPEFAKFTKIFGFKIGVSCNEKTEIKKKSYL